MITLRANHSTTIGWVKIRWLGQPDIKQTSTLDNKRFRRELVWKVKLQFIYKPT